VPKPKRTKARSWLWPLCPYCGNAKAKLVEVEYPDHIEKQHRGGVCYVTGGRHVSSGQRWVEVVFNCGLRLLTDPFPGVAEEACPCGRMKRKDKRKGKFGSSSISRTQQRQRL
jgi:hypothetical protein